MVLTQLENFPTLKSRLLDTMFVERFSDATQTADGIISGMEGTTDVSLNLPVSLGDTIVDGAPSSYAGGTITVPASVTDHCVWWDGSALQEGAAWPGTAHAKVCLCTTDGTTITAVDNTVQVVQDALDIANERLYTESGSGWNKGAWNGSSNVTTYDGGYFGQYIVPDTYARVLDRILYRTLAPNASGLQTIRLYKVSGEAAFPTEEAVAESIDHPFTPNVSYGVGTPSNKMNDFQDIGFEMEADQWYLLCWFDTLVATDPDNYFGDAPIGAGCCSGTSNPVGDNSMWTLIEDPVAKGIECTRKSEAVWHSTVRSVTDVNRIMAVARTDIGSLSEVVLEVSCDGSTWETIPNAAELIPIAASPSQAQFRVTVYGAASATAVSGFGAVWET